MWFTILVTLLFAIGIALALLNDAGAADRGPELVVVLVGVARLLARGCVSVSRRRGLAGLTGSSLTLHDSSTGLSRRVAGSGPVTWEVRAGGGTDLPRLSSLPARLLALARGRAVLAVTVTEPFVDWTHGTDGTLHVVRLLRDVGIVRDAAAPAAPAVPGKAPAAPRPPPPASTVATVVVDLEGRVSAGPLILTLSAGRLLVPEAVGRVLGGAATVDAAYRGGALSLDLATPTASVTVRGRRVPGGLALDEPVRATLERLDAGAARALLASVHPLLGSAVAVAAGGGGGGGGTPPRPVTVLLSPAGAALPCPALDVAVSPLCLTISPAGALADVAAAVGLGGGGGGGDTAAAGGPNMTLATTCPLRLTVHRGGAAVATRRLDARLALAVAPAAAAGAAAGGGPHRTPLARLGAAAAALAPTPPAVRLSMWGTVTPSAVDCRVGIPVTALTSTAVGRAVAADAAGPDEVVTLSLVGPPSSPRLDWRAAVRELPGALAGSRVRAAAAAAVGEALAGAAPPWLAGLATAAVQAAGRADKPGGGAAPRAGGAPPPTPRREDARFDWEPAGPWWEAEADGHAAVAPPAASPGGPRSGGSTPVLVDPPSSAPPPPAPPEGSKDAPEDPAASDSEDSGVWVAADAASGGWA